MSRPFLTAVWSNLCIVSYAVPPQFLKERIPAWLEPDTREGSAFLSLVAFQFRETRVVGVSWPGFQNFPELNLRVYVRYGDKRGVLFMREFVPQKFVALLARTLYNEPYLAAPVSSVIQSREREIEAQYSLSYAGKEQTISACGISTAALPPEDSAEHFFKEHRWGFGQTRAGEPLCYEVVHPVWSIYPVTQVSVDLNWSDVYGSDWSFLQDAIPCSTVLAKGSEVFVYAARRL